MQFIHTATVALVESDWFRRQLEAVVTALLHQETVTGHWKARGIIERVQAEIETQVQG